MKHGKNKPKTLTGCNQCIIQLHCKFYPSQAGEGSTMTYLGSTQTASYARQTTR